MCLKFSAEPTLGLGYLGWWARLGAGAGLGCGLGWAGLGWAGLGWAGLGWAGLGWELGAGSWELGAGSWELGAGLGWAGWWAGLGWAGLGWAGWAGLGWAGLGWAGLGWAGLGWAGLGWAGLGWPYRRQCLRLADAYVADDTSNTSHSVPVQYGRYASGYTVATICRVVLHVPFHALGVHLRLRPCCGLARSTRFGIELFRGRMYRVDVGAQL